MGTSDVCRKRHAAGIAPAASVRKRCFRITHPFHPLYPGVYDVLEYRRHWGHELVAFYDAAGKLVTIPIPWTDLAEETDPFVVISGGRSFFRIQDLLRLSETMEDIESCGRYTH